jgi:hypothetical protein
MSVSLGMRGEGVSQVLLAKSAQKIVTWKKA